MRVPAASLTMSLALAACGTNGSSLVASTDDVASTTEGDSMDGGADDGVATGPGAVDSDAPNDDASGASTAGGADGTGGDDGIADSSTGAPSVGTDDGSDFDPPEDALLYEPFDAPDGDPWAEHWDAVGGLLASDIIDGRGRLQGQTATVGRMVVAGVDALDVDASATVVFDDWSHQGFGLYVRQNGGYLVETNPTGQGYALYVEGGYMQLLGVWRERNGVEEMIAGETVDGGELQSGTAYRVRFRCTQQGDQTRLQARLWPANAAEPDTWAVDVLDATPELQGTSGTLAVDIYNYQGTASILIDDITLMPAS